MHLVQLLMQMKFSEIKNLLVLFKRKTLLENSNKVFYLAFVNYFSSFIAACAAASLAIGTLNGEHDT